MASCQLHPRRHDRRVLERRQQALALQLEPALPGYSDAFVERFISQVRIDLDVFSEGEIAVLENHGYLIAETAIRRHAPELATKPPPLVIPHPEWMDEKRAAVALADSSRTRFFSRRLRI